MNTIKEIKKFTNKIVKSKRKCKNFLIKAGIITKKGNLRKPYK